MLLDDEVENNHNIMRYSLLQTLLNYHSEKDKIIFTVKIQIPNMYQGKRELLFGVQNRQVDSTDHITYRFVA